MLMIPKSPIPELTIELLLSIGLLSLSLMVNNFKKSPGSVEIETREDADEDYYLNMVFIDGTVVNVENFSGIGEDGDVFIQTLEGIFARFIDRLEDE